ncbi:MAG: hypothetical protein AB2A00_24345 [Myxococcota bacterium]
MTLQLKVSGLPAFQAPEVIIPRLAQKGARVSQVIRHDGALVFRAEGSVAPGVYVEEGGKDARPLVLDSRQSFHVNPVAAGGLVAVHRGQPGRIPALVEEVLFIDGETVVMRVPGQTVGVSGDGTTALVADVPGKTLHRVDLPTRTRTRAAGFAAGMNPHLAPVLALDVNGKRALFMDAREERCDGSLELLDLESGTVKRLLGPSPAPSRVCGAFSPSGNMIALEMRVGDTPQFRMLRIQGDEPGAVALKLEIAEPLSVPAFLDENHVVLPLTLTTHPNATYGPVELVMVSLVNGTTVPITRGGEVRGRARVEGDAVLLEGGDVVLRIPWRAG